MVKNLYKFFAAAAVYFAFAFYLYYPYLQDYKTAGLEQYFFIFNVCLASLGVYVLSRRWVASFIGSFFAGAIYGFGPFILGLAKYHPIVVTLAAAIPWMFCPSAFGPKGRLRWLRTVLASLPFLVIFLFFQLLEYRHFFPIPKQTRIHLEDFLALVTPLVVAERSGTIISFYHFPIAALSIGFLMLLAARRFGVLAILCLSVTLGFCGPFLNICSIIWFAIFVLCCSVLIGAGVQGFIEAGFADCKWLLINIVIMLIFLAISLIGAVYSQNVIAGLGAKYAKLFIGAAKMYLAGAVAIGILLFMVRAKLRLHWLREVIMCCLAGIDIFLGATYIVDTIF